MVTGTSTGNLQIFPENNPLTVTGDLWGKSLTPIMDFHGFLRCKLIKSTTDFQGFWSG
jgi:hypothetical protein